MRKKIVALIVAGGLMLGMSGCGGSQSTTAYVPEDSEVESTQNALQEPKVEENKTTNFDQAKTEETETIPEEKNLASNIDVSSLLANYTLEYTDYDGYQFRETIQISPIFRESDSETMYALWEALGNDVADFPSKEELYDISWVFKNMRDRLGCNELEYIIGTYTVENLTNGFSITPDNPRSYDRRLLTERVLAYDNEHDATATDFFGSSLVSVVMYPEGATYYSDPEPVVIGKPKMTSDIWGPCAFIIALPNGRTPNQPDGYRYDKVGITIGNKGYGDSGYDVFELAYYE